MSVPAFVPESAPPPRVKYEREASWLREHPGEWLLIRECETPDAAWSAAIQIRNGRRAAFRPAGAFEASAEGLQVKACYLAAALSAQSEATR